MNILANLKRKRILKHITGNLGKVVEEEDKIKFDNFYITKVLKK